MISLISMAGVAIITMALIIVLSVFNGLEDFIRTLYNSFDPDMKIMPVKGKSFDLDSLSLDKLKSVDGVANLYTVIEDNAYVKYRDAEMAINMKGVDEDFLKQDRLRKSMVEGNLILMKDHTMYAVIGLGIQYALNIKEINDLYPLQFFYPNRDVRILQNPARALNRANILISGVFAIEKQFDSNYVIVPIEFTKRLMDYDGRRTAVEIMITENANPTDVKEKLQSIAGSQFQVQDSDEQHSSLISAIKWEKLFVFITFSFIIAVAAVNIFFSLSMLAIDKKKDIAVLFSMGGTKSLVRSIFIREGAIISITGAVGGMILGIIVCFLQQQFGFVSLGIQTSVIDAYPVKMQVSDFIFSGLSIILITLFSSSRPAMLASRSKIIELH